MVTGRVLIDIAKTIDRSMDRECAILSLDDDLDKPIDLTAIIGYFGEDENREGICTLYKSRKVGYIRRDAFYNVLHTRVKGIAVSDDSRLPGEDRIPIYQYHCPIEGCGIVYFSTPFFGTPNCNIHGVEMILIS